MTFEDYNEKHLAACLDLFDQNCPQFFADNERQDYEDYLLSNDDAYKVGLVGDDLVAAFGISTDREKRQGRVTWIMASPNVHGQGIGAKMMGYAIECARAENLHTMQIAASHLSASFFAKFGATEIKTIEHGWGPDMHRVDMEIVLS